MRVVIATSNAGKLSEIRAGLSPLGWDVTDLSQVKVGMPPENAASYEENAALKACAVALQLRTPAIGDDSGLEVSALRGEPGIFSARYGNKSSDLERNIHLLENLRGARDRSAKFVSVMVLAYPDGHLEVYRGEVSGQILLGPRGYDGFGYDPLFVPDGLDKTFAEISLGDKMRISHRARALYALRQAHKNGPPARQTIKVS